MNKRPILIFLALNILIAACNLPGMARPWPTAISTALIQSEPTQTVSPPTVLPSPSPSSTFTVLPSATETETPLPTLTATITLTPTETPLPSITPSSTFAFPAVTVNKQAHCRYGPATAYLHAADLYPGDTGTVRGRFQLSKWLYIKFDKLDYFCWVAPSVVDVVGDITTIKFTQVKLPGPSVLYNPPSNVIATRAGNKVQITWDMVDMTDDDDRGYFLDLFVCQDSAYIWFTVALDNKTKTSYTIRDESGCSAPSSGKLYAVEKHGYTRPVEISWPLP